jgi:uncharacterized membrane protein YjgN (DUF898 family)
MDTVIQDDGRASVPAAPAAATGAVPPLATEPERLVSVRFTGSGSEYFRIWIVNLLLSIVTLSLYRPWAKVRRLKYFYGNTIVGGHAFDFHGNPWKMLRGYLLVGAMLVVYSVAGRFSPFAALVAFVALTALWPALFRASMQFRLANTSWRGLRFNFSGDLAGAYGALVPAFLPAIVLLTLGANVDDPLHPPLWYFKGILGAMAFMVAIMPLALCNLKRYQHGHFGLGQWRTKLTAGPLSFYGLALKMIGIFLVSAIVTMIIAGMVVAMVMAGFRDEFAAMAKGHALPWQATLAFMVVGFLVYFIMLVVPVPFGISRLQNLVWGNTRADGLRFDSQLQFGELFGLTLGNWFLMLVTLGLYWPFAAVAMYRLRLESVTPILSADLDRLQQVVSAGANDASGDAAGDLFGIDIGL